jgi:hypothetical protein
MEEGWIMVHVHLESRSNLLLSSFHLLLLFSDQQILGTFDHAKLFLIWKCSKSPMSLNEFEFQSPVPLDKDLS